MNHEPNSNEQTGFNQDTDSTEKRHEPQSVPEQNPITEHPEKRSEEKPRESEWILEEVKPWAEPVDGKCLLNELKAALIRFVVLPMWAAETLALWIVHTYIYQWGDVSTYIGVESPEGRCGKSTLMAVLSELAYRAVVSSNISSPAVYHAVAEKQPTLLIDEADTFLNGNDEMRGILNSGYTRKLAYVVRVGSPARRRKGDSGEGSSLKSFSSWCPKVIARIGRLPATLADRCIMIRMDRKMREEEVQRLRDLDGKSLRSKCKRFGLDHGQAIAKARPNLPKSLNDRAADIWEPLLALADAAGGDWPSLARQAAEHLSARAEEANPTASLLLDIFLIFVEAKTDRIFTRTLVEHLNSRLDRPWQETRNGKDINEIWLSKQLRAYKVRPRTIRIDGILAKGYLEADFKEVFRRYIPKSEFQGLMAKEDRQEAGKETEQLKNPEEGKREQG